MVTRPPRVANIYNQQLDGVYGVFGSGSGLQAFYLQSAIAPSELARLDLISDISGSEKWSVRDLFQRDVDNKRIEKSLLPYLETVDKIKFFNPLTLTILPMGDDGYTVLNSMPKIMESVIEEDESQWQTLEREGFYRIQWVKDNEQYARLKWNDRRSRLVAIDGQHRLSALKRFLVDQSVGTARDDFMSWRIPVTVVSFRAVGNEPPSVLEVVRSVFVAINTQAHEVNKARAILLSDESINSVCTQELIQYSHENDVKAVDERRSDTLPLLFYDWRGEESDKNRIAAPASVTTVEEIRDWFEWYILGEDFRQGQKAALGIDPTQPLHGAFSNGRLTYEDSNLLRNRFKEELLPAVSHLLQQFAPFKDYVEGLRALEMSHLAGDKRELAAHAFTKLRFGSSHAPDRIKVDVDEMLGAIEKDIDDLKHKKLDYLLIADIGMRGVVCAFGDLAYRFAYPDWIEYSAWFTTALNKLYDDGWLTYGGTLKRFLHHVAVDHNETIVNYRLNDVQKALGVYVELLVITYGAPMPDEWNVSVAPVKDELMETLSDTVVRGYKKEVRPRLRDEYPDGGIPLTSAVKKEAEKLAKSQIQRFEKKLKKVG